MVFVGMKVFVLTSVASITSLIFIFLIILYDIPLFAGIDYVVNSICLCLMSAYYDDDIYYKRICFICVKCCDPKGYSTKKRYISNKKQTKDKLTTPDRTDQSDHTLGHSLANSTTSADTMSQIRHAHTALKKGNDGNSY
eukprot:728203_1